MGFVECSKLLSILPSAARFEMEDLSTLQTIPPDGWSSVVCTRRRRASPEVLFAAADCSPPCNYDKTCNQRLGGGHVAEMVGT